MKSPFLSIRNSLTDCISAAQQASPSYRLAFLIFIIASAFFLADIGENSIRYSDEATHVRVIQEMHQSGDFLRPTLDGQLYLNKPPLKMWLTLGVINVLGQSNFSFRLIDGLCSGAIVAITFLFGSALFGSLGAGLLASLILLGSQGFLYGGRFNTATQDAFVVFVNTLALWFAYLIVRSLQAGEKRKILRWLILMGLALAAGVLSKSVVGLVPLIILLVPLVFHFNLGTRLFREHSGKIVIAVLVGIIPILLYFAQLLLRFEGAWGKVFGYDIKERLFTEGFHNPEKWWFYLDRLFIQSEFAAAWLLACGLLFQLIRSFYLRKVEQTFLASWAFVPLIIFSVLQSRAFHYLGPAFPAFALVIVGFVIWSASKISWGRGVPRQFAAICFSCIFLLSIWEIARSGTAATKRMINNKRKLPIEEAILDIRSQLSEPEVGLIGFDKYLEGDTYQRWRQQFYLDSLNAKAAPIKDLQSFSLESKGKIPEVIFANYEEGIKILSRKDLREIPCAYAPLWKPESRRQSVRSNPGRPDGLAIQFRNCTSTSSMRIFKGVPQNFHFSVPSFVELSGLSGGGRVAGISFKEFEGHSASFLIPRDDVFIELGASGMLMAAVRPIGNRYPEMTLGIRLNGNDVANLKIAGGKFRPYSFEIPARYWARDDNFLSFHIAENLHLNDKKLGLLLSKLSLVFKH